MQPLRILDTPVTMRYIKYIVDITSRARVCVSLECRPYVCICRISASVHACECITAYLLVRPRVADTCHILVYIVYPLCASHVCMYAWIWYVGYRLSFVYCVWLPTRPRIPLGPSAICTIASPCTTAFPSRAFRDRPSRLGTMRMSLSRNDNRNRHVTRERDSYSPKVYTKRSF